MHTVESLNVTVLCENTAGKRSVLGEHGLSLWVEADGRCLLFDTGQGRTLAHNVEALGVPLERAEAIVLSHGHYDHAGGLPAALAQAGGAKLYAHPAALEAKYAREPKPPHRYLGVPREAEARPARSGRFVPTPAPTEVLPGVFVTGQIPRQCPAEAGPTGYYVDATCARPDPLLDDQAMYVLCAEGVVVLLGCAHAGVVNTLDFVAATTGRSQIHAVLGGMHLGAALPARLAATADALTRYGVRLVAPCHCTGAQAVAYLWSRFPRQWVPCSAGDRFRFRGR